jgi:hypothetical protein
VEPWHSTEESASYLGVSRLVIGRLARSWVLPVYRSSFDRRARCYDVEDLDAIKVVELIFGRPSR